MEESSQKKRGDKRTGKVRRRDKMKTGEEMRRG